MILSTTKTKISKMPRKPFKSQLTHEEIDAKMDHSIDPDAAFLRYQEELVSMHNQAKAEQAV